jgi:hypothetical protein
MGMGNIGKNNKNAQQFFVLFLHLVFSGEKKSLPYLKRQKKN